MSTTTRTLAAIALAATIALSSVGSAEARKDKPRDDRMRIDEQVSEIDDFLTELCGFEITFSLDTKGWVRFGENSIHVTEQGSVVLTNTGTGKTLTNEWNGNFKGRAIETVEDGILTVEFRDVYAGVPERWRDHDGKILIADRGRAVFEGTVVIDLGDDLEDPEDDEVLHFHEEITTNGPHPILEQGFLDPSLACELLA